MMFRAASLSSNQHQRYSCSRCSWSGSSSSGAALFLGVPQATGGSPLQSRQPGAAYIVLGATYLPFYLEGSSAGVVGADSAVHLAGGLVIFVLGPIGVISSYRFTRAPVRYVWLGLGAF